MQEELDDAEADYVVYRIKNLAMNPMPGEYNMEHLLKMHHYIFQDIYEWAGEPRIIAIYKEEDVLGGISVVRRVKSMIDKMVPLTAKEIMSEPAGSRRYYEDGEGEDFKSAIKDIEEKYNL